MDQGTWIFHMCLCFGCLVDSVFSAYGKPLNPELIRMGVAYDVDKTHYSMQSNLTDQILIPDRDVTFPSDGKLLNFSYWLSKDDPSCKIKVVALRRSMSEGYAINDVSAIYNLGSYGWNTINFTLDDGYLNVRAGNTIGFSFSDVNYMKYFSTAPGIGSCTNDGIMERIYNKGFHYLRQGLFYPANEVTSTSNCRSYIYQANYIPDDVYLNITLNSDHTLNQSLPSDRTNSIGWTVTAPPDYDGEAVVVAAVFTTLVLTGDTSTNYANGCSGSAVKLVDGNGETLKFLCGSPSSSVINIKIYSITDTMHINYTTIPNYEDTRITLQLSVIKKSEVPSGYYDNGVYLWLEVEAIAGIVVAIIVLAAIIGLFIYKKNKASVASKPAPADVTFKPRADPRPEQPPPAWNQPSAPSTQPPHQPMGGDYFSSNYPSAFAPMDLAYPPS